MGALEDTLRATFADRVATVPAVDDSAGRAIEGARRARRRRVALGAIAAATAIVLAGGAMMVLAPHSGWGGPDAISPPSTDATLPAELLVGSEIRTVTGDRISLSGLPPAERAYHVYAGWLVVTYVDGSSQRTLWLITTAGRTVHLIDAVDFAVGPDGRRIAWGGNGSVGVAQIADDRLDGIQTTPGTGSLRPVAFAGTGVLLAGSARGDGTRPHDVWYPGRGNYRAGRNGPSSVYGISGRGDTLYASVPGTNCLGDVNPDGFALRRSTCTVRVVPGYELWESPDGKRLLVSGEGLLAVYDISTLWTDGQAIAVWPVRAASTQWLDDNAIVAGGVGSVTLVRVDHAYKQDATLFFGGADSNQRVTVVPDLVD